MGAGSRLLHPQESSEEKYYTISNKWMFFTSLTLEKTLHLFFPNAKNARIISLDLVTIYILLVGELRTLGFNIVDLGIQPNTST